MARARATDSPRRAHHPGQVVLGEPGGQGGDRGLGGRLAAAGQVGEQPGDPPHRVVGTELDDAAVGGAEPLGQHVEEREGDAGVIVEHGTEVGRRHHPAGDGFQGHDGRHAAVGSVVERGQLADEIAGPPQAEHRLGPGDGGRGHLHVAGREQQDEPAGVAGDEDRLALAVVPGPARPQERVAVGVSEPIDERAWPRRVCPHGGSLPRGGPRAAGVLPAAPAASGRSPGSAGVGREHLGREGRPQRGGAQSPNSRSVSTTQATPASGSTHRNVPRPAEVPEGARRPVGRGPVRRLGPLELEAQPPRVGVVAAEARDDACEPGELLGGRLGQRRLGDQRRGPAARPRRRPGRRRSTRRPWPPSRAARCGRGRGAGARPRRGRRRPSMPGRGASAAPSASKPVLE